MAANQVQIEVEGMTCGGCASRVTSALQRDPRVSSAVVDFATRSGVVDGDLSRDDIAKIIASVGYKLAEAADAETAITSSSASGLSPEFKRLLPAATLALPVVILAMGPWHPDSGAFWQMILTTLFLMWPARGFFLRAVTQVSHGFVTMDTLVSIGMGSAWLVSMAMIRETSHHLFFESAVMIGFFVLMGKAMEDRARRKSISDVDRLVKLRPRRVWKVKDDGAPEEVFLGAINIGDLIYLRPGDMLALDGVVSEGSGSFDESVITGESLPVVRQLHDPVPSGAVNAGSSGITIKITRVGQDTTIEQIIRLIEDARLSKPPIQLVADRISAVFVPVVMFLALATFLYWWLTGRREFNDSVMVGLSVLVVACPCALGLATPVAWVAGLGRAARAGVLVRSYDALETLRKANTIIFDKTGTLTYGKPTVTRVTDGSGNSLREEASRQDAMAKTMSVLAHSSHPISRSVALWIKEHHDVSKAPLSKLIEETAGLGVSCEIKSDHKELILYGRPDFVAKDIPPAWQTAIKSGHPLMAVSFDGKPALLFELNDEIRSDANTSLAQLNRRGIAIHIASGDKDAVVAELAKSLPLVASFKGQMSPVAKKDLVESLRKGGRIVAFVGDGINDAPALAAADVGISLGTGTDIAAHSAGLVLQKSGINTLIDAIDLSSRITKIIRENFFWAFFYNVAAIPAAMAGLVTPMWASAAMAMSSLSVVLNALRLRR